MCQDCFPDDSRPLSTPRRQSEGGLRRSIVLGLPALFLLTASRAAPPPDPSLLDPDERMRLRRELRQAHRERMRAAAAAGGATEPSQPFPTHHESGRSAWGPPSVHPPDASWPRRRADGSWPAHDAAGSQPGRFALSDEEREQLRRQLREQRAARRAAQSAQPPSRGTVDP